MDVPLKARAGKTAEPRKRLLVLPFLDVSSDRSQDVAETARRTFIRQLLATDQFVVVDLADFPKDLGQFKSQDEYDLKEVTRIASGMGIAGVVEGKIFELKARRLGDQVGLIRKIKAQMDATVRIRVYGSKNNRELLNETRVASVESVATQMGDFRATDKGLEEDANLVKDAVSKALKGIVPSIASAVKKITWEGKIALVNGERIFLNAGRLSGLQVGDILRVLDSGEDVFDPDSGETIGRAPGRMKGTIEVVSYFGKDGAIAVVHSGSGFKESDQVELY